MQFSQKLLELRKKRGFSQEDLAEKLNVSRQAISRWEMGSTMPDSPNLLKISDLFGVSIDSLLREDNQPEGKPISGKDQKKRNRQVAWAVLVGLHAMALLVGLTALFALQNTLAILEAASALLVYGLLCGMIWNKCRRTQKKS